MSISNESLESNALLLSAPLRSLPPALPTSRAMAPAARPRRPASATTAAAAHAHALARAGARRGRGLERVRREEPDAAPVEAAEAPAVAEKAAAAPVGASANACPRPRPRDGPPRLRFPLLLLLLVGPAAGSPAPAPAPARTLIVVDAPAGLPTGCENPITGDPMPQGAEWPDVAACRLLLCRLDAGKPIVEVVGCTPHVVPSGCRFEAAVGEQRAAFPNCCGRYVCPPGGPLGLRLGVDLDELVVYAI